MGTVKLLVSKKSIPLWSLQLVGKQRTRLKSLFVSKGCAKYFLMTEDYISAHTMPKGYMMDLINKMGNDSTFLWGCACQTQHNNKKITRKKGKISNFNVKFCTKLRGNSLKLFLLCCIAKNYSDIVRRPRKFETIFHFFFTLKFGYSEKVTNIWKNLPLRFDTTQ